MFEFKKIARLLAATAVCCSLAHSASAEDKMMGGKMAPKMGGKMMDDKMGGKMGGKMMGGKMDQSKMMMGKMSATEKKTYMGMSTAEKALFGKMMKMHMGKM